MDMISVLFNALALLSVLGRTGARTSSPNTTPSGPGPSTSDLRGQMFTVSYSYSIGFTMYTDAIFPSPSPTIYPSPSTSTSSSPSSSSANSPYPSPSSSFPSATTSPSSSPSSSSAYSSPYPSPSTSLSSSSVYSSSYPSPPSTSPSSSSAYSSPYPSPSTSPYSSSPSPSPSPTTYPSPSPSSSPSPSTTTYPSRTPSPSSPYSSPSTSPSPSTSRSPSSPSSSPSTFPSPSSSPSSTPYPSHSPSTSSSPSSPYTSYPYTTPSPSLSALTVCLRYMAEEGKDLTLFSLTQGNYWNLLLERNSGMDYLSIHSSSQSFRSYRLLWSIIEPRPWTSLCVTWEKNTGLAQVWRGRTVSIRKRVFGQVTNGPPVLKVYKFEGQVTDVEVWDSVLSPSWIMSYMSGWQSYWSYTPGNVLTWSKAIYSTNGEVLLERNTYNSDHQPIKGQRQHPRTMRRKKMRKCEWKKRARAEQIARTRRGE
ncbi:mucin-12 [Oncorhynchus kisutch]|uniref:Mucin-12-like n=1 Tax=Oncorhynchus kisutch TaxID=8019 RepID=A0A8C7KCC9_ONCKI|nr:mucin-12-like [Oncorhynchus kisutch]